MLNNVPQEHLKLLHKEQFKKKAEAAGDLIGNKIAEKITNVSRSSPHNNSQTVESETEIPIYMYMMMHATKQMMQQND